MKVGINISLEEAVVADLDRLREADNRNRSNLIETLIIDAVRVKAEAMKNEET